MLSESRGRERRQLIHAPPFCSSLAVSALTVAELFDHLAGLAYNVPRWPVILRGYVPDETIAFKKATRLLAQVKRNPVTFASPLGELLVESMRDLSQMRTRSDEWTGVPSGFDTLDLLTGGLQPSDLIMVATPSSTGKTSFVLSIALHAAVSTQCPIGIFSLQLNRQHLLQRLLTMSAGTDFYRLRMGNLADEEWERVVAAAEQLTKEAGIWIDDTADLSTEQLRQRARHLVEQEHVVLIIVMISI